MEKKTFLCVCGSLYNLISSYKNDININYCYKCHPYFTNKRNFIETSKDVKKFNDKYKNFFK